jgi:hypothetical protein
MNTWDCFILSVAAPVVEVPLLQLLLNLEPTDHMEIEITAMDYLTQN